MTGFLSAGAGTGSTAGAGIGTAGREFSAGAGVAAPLLREAERCLARPAAAERFTILLMLRSASMPDPA